MKKDLQGLLPFEEQLFPLLTEGVMRSRQAKVLQVPFALLAVYRSYQEQCDRDKRKCCKHCVGSCGLVV